MESSTLVSSLDFELCFSSNKVTCFCSLFAFLSLISSRFELDETVGFLLWISKRFLFFRILWISVKSVFVTAHSFIFFWWKGWAMCWFYLNKHYLKVIAECLFTNLAVAWSRSWNILSKKNITIVFSISSIFLRDLKLSMEFFFYFKVGVFKFYEFHGR